MNNTSRANQKKKEKAAGTGNNNKKIIEQEVYHKFIGGDVSMIENHISRNLHNELFSKRSGEKCTVF